MSIEALDPPKVGPNVVSLFSGAGGLDLGLAAAGFNIVFESDIDPYSCETLTSNRSRAVAEGLSGFAHAATQATDVSELGGTEIREAADLGSAPVDLLAGGPPCQAFSVFGRRRGVSDDRGLLVFQYCRLLSELLPRAFVLENVYGMLSVQGGAVFEEVLQSLSEPGDGAKYSVSWVRVNARDFGVPQSRDRVFVFGVREDETTSQAGIDLEGQFLEPGLLGTGPPWRTVNDGFRGLTKRLGDDAGIANHRGRKHGEEVTQRYGRLGFGERDGRTRINRLDPSRPSFTIVVGSDAGGGKGHVHPTEPREITPRESARLQTFPDWWEFKGNIRHMIRQVGNAVPPLLGFAVGNALRTQVFGMEAVEFSLGLTLLGQDHLFPSGEVPHLAGGLAESVKPAA